MYIKEVMLKNLLLAVIICLFFVFVTNAQNNEIKLKLNSISEVKEDSQKVNILNDVAFKFISINKDSAQLFANQALDIAERINYPKGIVQAYQIIGIYYDLSGDTTIALNYFRKALQLANNNKLTNEIGTSYWYIGSLYFLRYDYEKALDPFEKASKYLREVKNDSLLANTLLNYASSSYYCNKPLLSVNAATESIKIFESLKDTLSLKTALVNLSLSYMSLKQYNKAIECLLDAWENVKNRGNDYTNWVINYDIAVNYDFLKNYQASLEYYNKALVYAKKIPNEFPIGNTYNGMANSYFGRKELNNAKKYIDLAVSHIKENSDPIYSATTYSTAGKIYLELNKLSEAARYAHLSLTLANRPGDSQYRLEGYEVLSNVYEKTGNLSKSLEYYKKFKAANDSVYDETVISQVSEMQIIYESEKKDHENEILKKEQELIRETISKQHFYIFGVSAGLLLLVGTVSLLIFLNQNKKKTNKLLTKQKQDIEQLAENLSELNKTKDKFFSIIAHDLKNPFHTIMSVSSLIIEEYDELTDEEKKGFLSEMYLRTKNANTILENLLEWSRSQMGRIEFAPQMINLSKVVEENIVLLKSLIDDKRITLDTSVNEDISVFADKNMLNTIFRNLLTNANKFTNEGGNISINAIDMNDYVCISVKDTGIGISDENKNKIFSLGETPISYGTKNERGTGLGLLLCKEFVEKQGGKIWFESHLDFGTIFYFTIPKSKEKISMKNIDSVIKNCSYHF